MCLRRTLCAVGLLSLGSGCSIIEYSTRNLLVDPICYCERTSRFVSHAEALVMADEIFDELELDCSEQGFSEDYRKGFKAGFADYVLFGGTGDPPVVPPRHYWQNHYQTPEGYQAIQDWYAGFRHGSLVAMEGGYRQYVPVPTSLTPDQQAAGRQSESLPYPEAKSPHELLPPPKENPGEIPPGSGE
jgi:hypothetical protein